MSFISELKKDLPDKKNFLDLTKNSEFIDFDLIGFRDSPAFLEFAAFVEADKLTERQIVDLSSEFFEVTRKTPAGFNLKARGRNPNGLLAFVFEEGCSEQLIAFIAKQSKAAHWTESGVIVSWTIDVKNKKIHTHNNPVTILPPVIILAETVYPGFSYLKSFLDSYTK